MDLCESNSACDRHMLWAEVSPRRRLLMPSQCWLHVRHDIRKIFGNRALGRSQTARYHPTPTPPAPPLNKLVKGWFPGVPMAVYQCTFWVVPCILLAPHPFHIIASCFVFIIIRSCSSCSVLSFLVPRFASSCTS